MKKEYLIILLTYIAMQLSSFIGAPLLLFIGSLFGNSAKDMAGTAGPLWLLISFSAALIIILFILRKEMFNPVRTEKALSPHSSINWAFGGVFLALIAQSIAANIEYLLGIELGSENTQKIMGLIEMEPMVIIVTTIIGPILEEIVFRKILFGTLYKYLNFFISAIISSLIFAIAHGEIEHLLIYSAMGLTFAFLYVKTKRILVPIFAHVSMNSIVVLMQLNQDWLQQL